MTAMTPEADRLCDELCEQIDQAMAQFRAGQLTVDGLIRRMLAIDERMIAIGGMLWPAGHPDRAVFERWVTARQELFLGWLRTLSLVADKVRLQ